MTPRRSTKHNLPSIKCHDVKMQIATVLTNRWQTIGVISAQIVFAPELVERKRIVSGRGNGPTKYAKTNMVSTVLKHMTKKGDVDRKKNNEGRWIYRKKQV